MYASALLILTENLLSLRFLLIPSVLAGKTGILALIGLVATQSLKLSSISLQLEHRWKNKNKKTQNDKPKMYSIKVVAISA